MILTNQTVPNITLHSMQNVTRCWQYVYYPHLQKSPQRTEVFIPGEERKLYQLTGMWHSSAMQDQTQPHLTGYAAQSHARILHAKDDTSASAQSYWWRQGLRPDQKTRKHSIHEECQRGRERSRERFLKNLFVKAKRQVTLKKTSCFNTHTIQVQQS